MKCRVGMSLTPNLRIDYWKRLEGHTRAKILATNLTYDEAVAKEQSEARSRGCQCSGGSDRDVRRGRVGGRVWSIYYVDGGNQRSRSYG